MQKKKQSARVTEEAMLTTQGKLDRASAVYFATGDGNMVSFTQGCYTGFGSGSVVPNRGIALHNRASQFNLELGHPNCLEPRKRPLHTIIPGFITKDNKPVGPFGVMGGPLQLQAHMQVVSLTFILIHKKHLMLLVGSGLVVRRFKSNATWPSILRKDSCAKVMRLKSSMSQS